MTRLALALAAIALSTACDADHAATPWVPSGAAVSSEVAPGRPAQFGVALDAGAALVAAVAQRGVDVAVTVTDPSGRERLRVDWVGGRVGSEPIALRADQGGTWVITAAAGAGEPAGAVLLRRPAPAPGDDARVDAFAVLTAARDAARAEDGASLRAARAGYEDARARFAALGDGWGEAQATDQLGRVLKTLGDRRAALPLRERALALRTAAKDRFGVATSALGVANLRAWFGETDASVARYRQALAAAREIGDPRSIAIVTTNLGMTWDDGGDYPRALAAYHDALAVQTALGDDHGAAFSHQGLGGAYRRLGHAERAVAHSKAALRLRERLGETRWAAGDHYALGLVRLELEGDDVGAIAELRAALELRAGLDYFSDRDPQVRVALARAYANLGLTADALHLLAEAQADQSALGLSTGDVDLALGDTALLDGDPAGAAGHYQRALAGDSDAALLRTVLRAGAGLARARFALGDRNGARTVLEQTLARVDEVRLTLSPALLRGTWLGAWRTLHDLLVAIELSGLDPDLGRAFRDHERGLARALLDELAPTDDPGDLAAVQAALGPDEALISLALADDRSFAFVVTRARATVVPLAPRAAIVASADALVSAVIARASAPDGEPAQARRARVAAADAQIPALAAALGDLVWSPLAGDLPEHVVLIGDPALEAVPFELLPAADGAPTLVRHQLTYAPSAATWLALAHRSRPTAAAVLVVADPVFGTDDPRVAGPALPGPSPFARLRFSAVEADAIRANTPTARVLDGLAARRDALLATAGGPSPLADYGVVHFATHVVIDAAEPARSGLVLSQVDALGAPRDGLLTAGDVRGMRLAADLVVLSGCASALGRATRGEGVMGLARAFLAAGARRTLVSRWRVHDRGTAQLMARFYAARRDGLDHGAALRRAALELRADPRWAPPYYWASFALIGGTGE